MGSQSMRSAARMVGGQQPLWRGQRRRGAKVNGRLSGHGSGRVSGTEMLGKRGDAHEIQSAGRERLDKQREAGYAGASRFVDEDDGIKTVAGRTWMRYPSSATRSELLERREKGNRQGMAQAGARGLAQC